MNVEEVAEKIILASTCKIQKFEDMGIEMLLMRCRFYLGTRFSGYGLGRLVIMSLLSVIVHGRRYISYSYRRQLLEWKKTISKTRTKVGD